MSQFLPWARAGINDTQHVQRRRRWCLLIALPLFVLACLLGLGASSMLLQMAGRTVAIAPLVFFAVVGTSLFAASGWIVVRAWSLAVEAGRCHQCGYDLRQSLEICPECGTATAARASSPKVAPRRRRRLMAAAAWVIACVPLYGYFVRSGREHELVAVLITLCWSVTSVLAAIACIAIVARPPTSRATVLTVMGFAFTAFVGLAGLMRAINELMV